VVFLVAVTTVAAVVGLPSAFADRRDAAARNAALSFSDREIAGGNGLIVDQRIAYQALARIPPGATYRVAMNPRYRGGTALTVPYATSYFTYFLMPRRPASDAPWVICYGCDLPRSGVGVETVWKGPGHLSLLRIRQ
jgi:hypothetical protein